MLILPGYGSFPRAILEGSNLPSKARKRGYIVVIPYLGVETFYLDSVAQHNLKTLIPEIHAKYNMPSGKFIIGGHSAGGNAALLYAAQAFQSSGESFVRPVAAFGIDPLLDMRRFRNTVSHEIEINFGRTMLMKNGRDIIQSTSQWINATVVTENQIALSKKLLSATNKQLL